jgi:hypothetical protein
MTPSIKVIRAELHSDDTATALGITVSAAAPVLALCRALVAASHDPSTRLEAYRGPTLCLTVCSIGARAQLEINAGGTGFRRRRQADAAPPMRQTRQALAQGRPDAEAAP